MSGCVPWELLLHQPGTRLARINILERRTVQNNDFAAPEFNPARSAKVIQNLGRRFPVGANHLGQLLVRIADLRRSPAKQPGPWLLRQPQQQGRHPLGQALERKL